MACHSDKIPLYIGLCLTGLLPMYDVYSNFDTITIVLSCHKAKEPILFNRAQFNVTSLV